MGGRGQFDKLTIISFPTINLFINIKSGRGVKLTMYTSVYLSMFLGAGHVWQIYKLCQFAKFVYLSMEGGEGGFEFYINKLSSLATFVCISMFGGGRYVPKN